MVSSIEKINCKLVPIFKLKTFHGLTPISVSQACYFPPFTFDPSHTCSVIGPQTEGLPPHQGFLLSIPMPADLLTQILSMAYCCLSFFVKPPKLLPPIHTFTPCSSLNPAWYLFTQCTEQSYIFCLHSPSPLILVHFVLSI